MDVVAGLSDRLPLGDTADFARRVESMGYDVLHVPETVHDGLAVALLALDATERLRVRTSITLAFVRSPMLVAYAAWDLQSFSGGRFSLGLGSQIKQNIEGRYAMPWSEPVDRMSDYVDALHAIWHCFETGDALDFNSANYTFDRLQPFFNPGPIDQPSPPIWLGGVNQRMCGLAGRSAEGFVTHPTNSCPRYLTEVCVPKLREGAVESGRSGGPELVTGSPFITGPDAAAVDERREHQRRSFGFLYSTPAYRRTLELVGHAELGERLQQMTREKRWDRLHDLVPDDVLDAIVPQATWDALPDVVDEWFGNLVDGVILPVPDDPTLDDRFAEIVAAVGAIRASSAG